jgi:hypothetical protein
MLHYRLSGITLTIALGSTAAFSACSATPEGRGNATTTGLPGSGGGVTGASSTGMGGSFFVGSGGSVQGLDIEPSTLQTITVQAGTNKPTVTFTAKANGQPTKVTWSVDQGDLGSIPGGPSTSGVFTPSGTTGGLCTVVALQGKQTVQRQVFIKLVAPMQNGANSATQSSQIATMASQLTQGGGVGGVGGEGLGPPVSNFPKATMPAAMGLKFVYPYDKTVWPRGMLAPLLMWDWAYEDADAIQINLKTTSGSFSWTGQFGRPALAKTFVRHPIPQDVWDMATNTAGGPTPNKMPDLLVVSLTVAKGGTAYGPISETWTVAPGRLAGTVYYSSYGTHLVSNSLENSYNNGPQYGAAVLGIKSGDTGPSVVAGSNSSLGSGSGCRVCHVVSPDGSTLTAQHGDQAYLVTSSYNLKNANAETVLGAYDNLFGWGGLYTDASLALTNDAQLAANPGGYSPSRLFPFPPTSGTPVTVTGIPANLMAGAPTFSPDGKHVAFELLGGTLGTLVGGAAPSQLVALDFDQPTLTFSNPRPLAMMPGGGSLGVGQGGGQNAGFPAFFPTNDAVVFHNQLSNPQALHRYNTWRGATAQVWWSDLATGTPTALATLNGFDLASKTSYLPTNAAHADDTVLNYEPTVAPVVSGGYAWVVFTSRRLYGNLATSDPFQSDPRTYDANDYTQITCKKLWVAAVDIGAIKNGKFVEGVPPGTDPSHPAFYLPAQELMAGQARGFWVLDPCRADGTSCMTGDQCCSGYCEASGDAGSLTCGKPPSSGCSGLQEKCTTAANCCDPSAICINGFCALPPTQ